MQPREVILEAHNVMRLHKEHVWYKHHDNDMPPQLSVRWRDMPAQAINLAQMIVDMHRQVGRWPVAMEQRREVTRPARILWGIFEMMTTEGVYPPEIHPPPSKDTPIEMIMLAVEGYQAAPERVPEGATEEEVQAQADALLANTKHGDLEREYHTNPDSGIHETLITYVIETGPLGLPEWARVSSAVRKEDGGRLAWDEPLISTSEDPTHDGEHDLLVAVLTRYVRRENLT